MRGEPSAAAGGLCLTGGERHNGGSLPLRSADPLGLEEVADEIRFGQDADEPQRISAWLSSVEAAQESICGEPVAWRGTSRRAGFASLWSMKKRRHIAEQK
jgi:hypothetical protein